MRVCPDCGEENPDRFRLCGFCGAPLAPSVAAPEVRRRVTVVFADLKDSTALGESIDPESLREVMNRYFAEMREILERHGGVVEKYIGDAIMSVFGLPRVHEDDALRAVRAATDMQQALADLNDELRAQWGVSLTDRIGVNTGEVVAGDSRAGHRLVTGDAVNLAARLEQAAPDMQVLIGESTYRLVRSWVEVEALPPLTLKGKNEPSPAYRLLAVESGEREVLDARRTEIVGRGVEMARLAQTLDAVVATRSSAVVAVVGEAGIGKSRLVEEFSRMAGGAARVLWGRCLAYGRGFTFWPLVEVVGRAAGITADDAPAAAREKLRALFPADSAGADAADRIAGAIGLSDRQYPVEEVYWGARKLFEELARKEPLVVVFEDVHWAESAFLDLIGRVTDTAEDSPLLFLCATRPELTERHPGWLERPGTQVLELQLLSSNQTALVLENMLGDAELDPTARGSIVSAADGNPLFAEQLLSMLIDDGHLRRDDERWVAAGDLRALSLPPTIDALLSARLDLLTHEQRAAIEPASVVGAVFELSAVGALAVEPIRDSVPAQLAQLEGKQLIERERTPPSDDDLWFRFHHILIRDAAYQGLLKRTRATLHERFAEWLEAKTSQHRRDVEYEEIVGYHLEQAYHYLAELGPLDLHGRELGERGAARLGAAGGRAFARADMSAAADLLRRAAALLPTDHPGRLGLLPVLGEALMEIGEFPWAIVLLDEAVPLTSGDPRLHADVVLTRLLVRHHVEENLERWRDEVTREAERLIPMLRERGADAQLAKAWRLLGFVHGSVCRYGEAAEAVKQAAEHARRARDARLEARNVSAYTFAAVFGPTPVEEAIEYCEQLAGQPLSDRQAEALVLCSLAQLRAMRGDAAHARDLIGAARRLLDELGVVVLAAATAMDYARIELLAGDLPSAETELRRAERSLTALGERYLLPPLAALLAQVVYAQGRAKEAEEITVRVELLADADDVEPQAAWRSVRAKVLAGRGEVDEAERLARHGVRLAGTTDSPWMQADALLDLAEVLRRAGRPDEARAAAAEALGLYELKGDTAAAVRAAAAVGALSS